MPPSTGQRNRGPAAAAENKRAILLAARRLFAERGYHVPLSAITREAGVSQAVLYRHFPTRLELAFVVFEENFAEFEAIASQPDAGAFERLWARLLDLTVEDAAFLEMVVDARRRLTDYGGADRLRALIEPPLARARTAGLTAPDLTVDDVMLVHRMAYGIAVTAIDPAGVRETFDRVLPALITGSSD